MPVGRRERSSELPKTESRSSLTRLPKIEPRRSDQRGVVVERGDSAKTGVFGTVSFAVAAPDEVGDEHGDRMVGSESIVTLVFSGIMIDSFLSATRSIGRIASRASSSRGVTEALLVLYISSKSSRSRTTTASQFRSAAWRRTTHSVLKSGA